MLIATRLMLASPLAGIHSTTPLKRIVAMNLKLLLVILAMSLLPACAHSVRDDSPASDLDALVSSVSRDLKVRMLPNGREYCAELAKTERAQDECLGDLEDLAYASNRDKQRAAATLEKGVKRIKLARNPCRWWQVGCRRDARKLDDAGE
jgi:hypothetical protein